MKVAYFPKSITSSKTTLVLGAFETIHNGHKVLINKALSLGKKVTVMVIEKPHTLPGAKSDEFASLQIRLEHLAALGIHYVSVVKFDENLRLMDGKAFIEQMRQVVQADNMVLGQDFVCGRDGAYKAIDIARDFEKVHIIEIQKHNNIKISTSLLKEMVQLGHVDAIKNLSPFGFEVIANVDSKGNFNFINEPKLHAGIYAVTAIINDIRYWAYVYVSQQGKMNLQVPDLQLKNSPFKAHITFLKMVRIIVASNKDQCVEEDIAKVANYLKNHI